MPSMKCSATISCTKRLACEEKVAGTLGGNLKKKAEVPRGAKLRQHTEDPGAHMGKICGVALLDSWSVLATVRS